MNAPFDIFQMIPVDRMLWRGTAGSVDEAQARVRELAGGAGGKYLILCLQTGTGLVVDAGEPDVTGDDLTREDRSLPSDMAGTSGS
jgi:hypothetical protein